MQHIACEPPGAYEDELRARGYTLERVEIDEGERLPDWREFTGLIVMGGPMGAYEEDRLPWLAEEKALIADAVRGGMPIWGVCLGAQLLAASLGASRRSRPAGRGGRAALSSARRRALPTRCSPCSRTSSERCSGTRDTWELPDGAVHLARSDAYEQQAFVYRRAYGVQFHLEVGVGLATEWGEVPAYAASLEAILGAGALPRLIGEVAEREQEMTELARRLFGAWIDHVVEP